MADERTSQNKERKQLSGVHAPTGDSRGKDKSEHRKEAAELGALTG